MSRARTLPTDDRDDRDDRDGSGDATGDLAPSSDVLPVATATDGSSLARWQRRAEQVGNRYQARARQQPLLGLPLIFLLRYGSRRGPLLASATAFRMFLWLLPLALLTSGILSVVAEENADGLESVSRGVGITGPAGHKIVTVLADGHRSWEIAVLVGAGLLLWATRALLRTLTLVHAHVAGIAPARTPMRQVLATSVILDSGLLVVTAAVGLFANVRSLGITGAVLNICLRVLAVSAAWYVICRRLPSRRRGLVDLAPGCVVFGAGLTALDTLSVLYLPPRFERSTELYGSLGTASVILAWLLIIGHLVVAAALTNVVWTDHRIEHRSGDLDGPPLPSPH